MPHAFRHALPLALLLLLAAANLFLGSVSLSPADVADALLHPDAESTATFIVVESRLPALITAALAGAALAVAGLLMQTTFGNPLADPGLLGVSTGASLGVAVALLTGGTVAGAAALSGFALTTVAALAGAAVVISLLLIVNRQLPGTLTLLIAGVMISFVASSLVSLLTFHATAQGVQNFFVWGLGHFSGLTLERLPLFGLPTVIALLLTLPYSRPLDALLLGDAYAHNLGLNVRRSRAVILLLAGILTALPTAVCGPVAFIGLAVPHAARLSLRTSSHRRLLPATMLWGADTALLCHLVSTLPGSSGILPINTITPLLGVPVVFALLKRR